MTLIKPGAIDIPHPLNANYMEVEPKPIPPVYSPETLAEAILRCAEAPARNVFVGSGGKGLTPLGQCASRLTDRMRN